MKLIHTLTIASAVLGLAGTSMAGSSAAAPASCSPDAFNSWNIEASYLHERARANNQESQDFENGARLAVSYQACPDSWGYRATYDYFKGSTDGQDESGLNYDRFTLEGFKTGLKVGPLDCSYSAGLRYANIEEPYNGSYDSKFTGLGPVVGFDVSYALPYNFSLYGNSELGYLWATDIDNSDSESHDYTFSFGWGVRYDIPCTVLEGAYIKAGYEVDHFEDLAYSNSSKVAGWVISLGYSF